MQNKGFQPVDALKKVASALQSARWG